MRSKHKAAILQALDRARQLADRANGMFDYGIELDDGKEVEVFELEIEFATALRIAKKIKD